MASWDLGTAAAFSDSRPPSVDNALSMVETRRRQHEWLENINRPLPISNFTKKEISPDPKSLNGIESDILPIRSQSTRVL